MGLYLHIPFCRDRCTYCAFTSSKDTSFKPMVLKRLGKDLAAWGQVLETPSVDTLYVGGGTPSLLDAEELTQLTAAIRGAFNLNGLDEATLEANPGTLDLPWLKTARGLGFDRLSLGMQTLDDALLAQLGRVHFAAQGLEALLWARRAGFTRLSADLMVGIPGQTLSQVLADARTLVEAGCEHLSIYLLDLHKDSPLKASIDAGHLALPSEDEVADVYEMLQEELPNLGLLPYEISNFARPNAESRHNTRYWERRPYLGLGPSAASHIGRNRWTEDTDILRWATDGGVGETEILSDGEDLAEFPLLGLRQDAGVNWNLLREEAARRGLSHAVDAWETRLEPCGRAGLLWWEGATLRLTPKGKLLSNQVFEIFMDLG